MPAELLGLLVGVALGILALFLIPVATLLLMKKTPIFELFERYLDWLVERLGRRS